MKKLISFFFMSLLGLFAIHANAQTETNTSVSDVACDTDIEVTATAEDKHCKFDYWVILDGSNPIQTGPSGQITPSNIPTGITSCVTAPTTVNGETVEQNTLKLKLTGALMDVVLTGPLTFKAYFKRDDQFTITGTYAQDEEGFGSVTVSQPNQVYAGDEVILTPEANSCYKFVEWRDANGNAINTDDPMFKFNSTTGALTVTASANWTAGETYTYYAHFEVKKVSIAVDTNDSSMGKVNIVKP